MLTSQRSYRTLAPLAALAFIALPLCAAHANSAATAEVSGDTKVLKICASANEAPYSMRDGEGFENRIANILADAMGRKAEFVWSSKPAIYLVQDQLNAQTCDVVMGLDTGDDRVLTSKAYYRAPYVFIQRKDSKLHVNSFDSPDLKKTDHIAFTPGGPDQKMLEKLDLFNRNFAYAASLTDFKSRRNQYTRIDPERFVSDVTDGKADVSIAFAPEVARYVKAKKDEVKMSVVPDDNVDQAGQPVPFHFDQSIGVRKDDKALLDQINAALAKSQGKINAALKEEGIPLLKPEKSRGTAQSSDASKS